MLGLWMKLAADTTLLAMEAQTVIGIRLTHVALGKGSAAEMQLMMTEKVDALLEATRTLVNGGSAETVVDGYRRHVQANSIRLQQPSDDLRPTARMHTPYEGGASAKSVVNSSKTSART